MDDTRIFDINSLADAFKYGRCYSSMKEEEKRRKKSTFLDVLIIIVDGIQIGNPRHVERNIIKIRK